MSSKIVIFVLMSLGIIIKGTEGIVLAAESRVTLTSKTTAGDLYTSFDNATKLLTFAEPHNFVGVVTYGQAAIGLRTAQSFMPEFEATLPTNRIPVKDFSEKLSAFMMDQWKAIMPASYTGPDMTFVVAGFDEKLPYGNRFIFEIPRKPAPEPQEARNDEFGISWGGQREFVDRIIQGFDVNLLALVDKIFASDAVKLNEFKNSLAMFKMNIPLAAMGLQDCVDLVLFFIRTTIDAQKLSVGIRGCGGHIDVATITRREGLKFVQKKEIKGETL